MSGHRLKYVRETNENKNDSKLGLPSDRTRLPDERNGTLFSSDTVLTGNVLGLPPLVIQFRKIHNLAATHENSTIKLLIKAKQNKTKPRKQTKKKTHNQTHKDNLHILTGTSTYLEAAFT